MRRPAILSVINNQRGIALLMAISVVSLILYLAMEVMYETNVEYVVNAQSFNRLKSYYAAKSGVDISLLRVKVYNQIKKQTGGNAGPMGPFLDQIWKFPLMWPLPIVDELGAAAKDEFNKASKESYLDADFDTKIEDESSKIDLNDLVSPSKVLRENTRKQILNMFKSRIESDEAFQERYGNVRFEELVNNIADWMSGQRESLNGGDKKNAYKEYDTESLPPSRAFRTLSELHLVAGMDDELYNMLEPRVTIYGLRGVNPNTASKDVIMSLDEGITSEIADAAIKRRDTPEEGGPFKTSKAGEPSDFEAFLRQKGARLSDTFKDIPFVYDSIVAFRVSAIGSFAKSSRKITVITFDLEESASRLTSQLKTEAPPSSTTTTTTIPGASQGQGTGSTAKKNTKGPPRIVYWTEE